MTTCQQIATHQVAADLLTKMEVKRQVIEELRDNCILAEKDPSGPGFIQRLFIEEMHTQITRLQMEINAMGKEYRVLLTKLQVKHEKSNVVVNPDGTIS